MMNRSCQFFKENLIVLVSAIVIILIAILAICTGVRYAYDHRIVEFKTYSVTAVVTDSYYMAGHFTTNCYTEGNGRTHQETTYHPPVYGLYYTVEFEGGTYAGNYATVSEPIYYANKNGGNLQATFRKEWRADGSETYSIYLN